MGKKRMPFGDRLRDLREAKGLSQHDLAALVGTSYVQISRLETGSREPRWGMVLRLADALGVGVTDFDAAYVLVAERPTRPPKAGRPRKGGKR